MPFAYFQQFNMNFAFEWSTIYKYGKAVSKHFFYMSLNILLNTSLNFYVCTTLTAQKEHKNTCARCCQTTDVE